MRLSFQKRIRWIPLVHLLTFVGFGIFVAKHAKATQPKELLKPILLFAASIACSQIARIVINSVLPIEWLKIVVVCLCIYLPCCLSAYGFVRFQEKHTPKVPLVQDAAEVDIR